MKILMIAPQPFLEPRGTPISVYQRLQALSSLGYQVDLLTYPLGADVDLPNINIHRVPRPPFVRQVKVGPSWSKLFLDFLLVLQTTRMLTWGRYDVIHSHEEAAFFAMPLSRLFGVKHLYDMHSSLPRQLVNFQSDPARPLKWLFQWLERRVLQSCDALITVGPDLAHYARRLHPAIRQVMIENLAVDMNVGETRGDVRQVRDQFRLHNRIPVVYTGTFERYQGIEVLIESTVILVKRHPRISLLLVGGKPEQIDYYRQVAVARGLQDHVSFAGTVPVDQVGTYLDVADILVSPRTEGTSIPLKLYSYLASGKPIVATDLQAHRAVLDDESSILVPATGQALADGISRLVRSPELRRQLASRALSLAQERYNPDAYLARVKQVYEILDPSSPSYSEPMMTVER